MKPFVWQYKSITITWYILFVVLALGISYLIFKISSRKFDREYQKKLDDMFFYVTLFGFIGARLSYVLFNFNLFKGKTISIIRPSQYNLSLVGGVGTGVIVLYLLSKRYKVDFFKSFNILLVPFYIAMVIGVWHFHFNILLSPVAGVKMGTLYLSFLFVIGLILELSFQKKWNNKYISFLILAGILFSYKII